MHREALGLVERAFWWCLVNERIFCRGGKHSHAPDGVLYILSTIQDQVHGRKATLSHTRLCLHNLVNSCPVLQLPLPPNERLNCVSKINHSAQAVLTSFGVGSPMSRESHVPIFFS
jgi:hypothetical protein